MCNDPTCRLCNSSLDYFMRYEPPMRRTYLSPALDEAKEALVKNIVENMQSALMKNTGGSMSTPTRQVIEDIKRLHKEGEDIRTISKEVQNILQETKESIVKSLSGVADLAARGKAQGHRFILAYWKDNEAKTLEGIDYAYNQIFSESDDTREQRVYVHGSDYPITGMHYNMACLKKLLNDRDIAHVVAYRDK